MPGAVTTRAILSNLESPKLALSIFDPTKYAFLWL